MAGLQKPISGLPSSSTFATADILPIVKSGNTDFITGGNFRTALFGIAQADPLSIGSLTAVGNSTITGTLSGITTFTATTGVFTAVSTSGAATFGGAVAITTGGLGITGTGAIATIDAGAANTTTFLTISIASASKTVLLGVDSSSVGFVGTQTAHDFTLRANNVEGLRLKTTGELVFATAVSKIVPGATSLSLRNNANTQDNLLIFDNGSVSVRGNFTLGQSIGFLNAVAKIQVGATSLAVRDNADTTNLMLFSSPGITLGVPLLTTASLAGQAGLNIPHGTAPTSPVNGDLWTTTGGAFVRINGVTKSINLT